MKNLRNKFGRIGTGLALVIGLAGCGEKPVEKVEEKTPKYSFTSIADFNRKNFPYWAGCPPVAEDIDNDGDLDILFRTNHDYIKIAENRIPRVENSEPEIKKEPGEY